MLDGERPEARHQVLAALMQSGYECQVFNESDAALEAVTRLGAEVLVVDLGLAGVNAGDILRRLRVQCPETATLMLVSSPAVSAGVAAIREGAFDYLVKPVNADELAATVARALELTALRRENRLLHEQLDVASMAAAFVAESPESRRLADVIRRAAPAHSPVLIEGESGAGKELVARMLHHWSSRARGPFVRLSFKSFAAGAGPDFPAHNLPVGAMAILAEHAGRAAGGTLFLDEIAEAGPEFQAGLLVLLGEQRTQPYPLGPLARDIRVVAATNRELAREVTVGRFRPDLYFALNVVAIRVAPLRDRAGDILPLARHFLALHAAESGRALTLAPDAENALVTYPWPGNVRELENVVERAVVLSSGERISAEALGLVTQVAAQAERAGRRPLETPQRQAEEAGPDARATVPAGTLEPEPVSSREAAPVAAPEPSTHETESTRGISSGPEPFLEGTLQECLDRAATTRIKAALAAARGDRNTVAATLGIDRATLNRLIKRLGL